MSKRDDGIIRGRIDRAMVNLNWLESYPRTQVFNLLMVGFDHSHVLVDIDYKDIKAPKQIKFKVVWTKKEECSQIIKEGWEAYF